MHVVQRSPDGPLRQPFYMKKRTEAPPQQEPLGIIISQGSREEQQPRFVAYIWGPAPDDTTPTKDLAAA